MPIVKGVRLEWNSIYTVGGDQIDPHRMIEAVTGVKQLKFKVELSITPDGGFRFEANIPVLVVAEFRQRVWNGVFAWRCVGFVCQCPCLVCHVLQIKRLSDRGAQQVHAQGGQKAARKPDRILHQNREKVIEPSG